MRSRDMNNTIQIYTSIVLFCAVMCLAIAGSTFLWDIVEVTSPEFTMNSRSYNCHQSDTAYTRCYSRNDEYTNKDNPQIFPTGAQLTNQRQQDFLDEKTEIKREAAKSAVNIFFIIIIDLLLIWAHWRLLKSTKENSSDSQRLATDSATQNRTPNP